MTPPFGFAYGALSLGLFLSGCNSESAQVRARMATVNNERSPELLLRKARAYAAIGDATRAEEYSNAALEAGGDERAITRLLLNVCVADRRYRAALSHAENFLRRHPRDRELRFVVATLDVALGQPARAIKELHTVIAAAPSDPEVRYVLAVVLRDELGDLEGADTAFREYLRLAPGGSHAEEAQGSLVTRIP